MINWLEVTGWTNEQLDELRAVGFAYIRQGLYDVAITFFEGLVVLSSENVYDLQTLGALYLQKGNFLNALNYLDRALAIDPLHQPSKLNRVKALYSLGYKKQAIPEAKQLELSKDPLIAGQASALLLAFA